MKILNAIFQGIIQGLAEFLPISSSGHLTLWQHIFGGGQADNFLTIMLHIGTLVAVFVAFRKEIGDYIVNFFGLIGRIVHKKFDYKTLPTGQKNVIMIFAALLPLFLILPIKDKIESVGDNIIAVGFCFLVTAVLLYVSARVAKKESTRVDITLPMALIIGCAQAVATLPGISRSGSTISVALLLGLSKTAAFDFSFILGIPAVLGAAILEFKDIFTGEVATTAGAGEVIVGIVVSAVVGVAAIKALRYILKRDKFEIFAYYVAAISIVAFIAGIAGK